MRLSEILDITGGTLVAEGEFEVLEYCTSNISKTFLTFLENLKFVNKISEKATCILCRKDAIKDLPNTVSGIIAVDEPKKTFHILHNHLADKEEYCGKGWKTTIGKNCNISATSKISEKNVRIGDGVIIEENVVIYGGVTIGNNVVIRSGAIIGGKAFSFARGEDDSVLGLIDVGSIVIEDDVEIFPSVHIAKGILPTDVTRIGKCSKIDAMVYIGHGTRIGDGALIAGCATIAGNVVLDKNIWVGVNATISNRIHVGDNAKISLGSVVTKDVPAGQRVSGNFAIEHEKFLRNLRKDRI